MRPRSERTLRLTRDGLASSRRMPTDQQEIPDPDQPEDAFLAGGPHSYVAPVPAGYHYLARHQREIHRTVRGERHSGVDARANLIAVSVALLIALGVERRRRDQRADHDNHPGSSHGLDSSGARW